jgi:RnfABCDGE-type electron transport complex B subunit
MGATLFISLMAMGGLGVFFATFLAVASKKLKVKENPIVEKILDELPQTNCGACGYAGCLALAEKMAANDAAVDACIAAGQEIADKIAELLGVESKTTNRMVAVVLCQGGDIEAVKNAVYRGEKTCVAANLTGGEKTCVDSCLGYDDCVRACQFDSMTMNDNGLPVVFYDACIGCGACARACPRDIIEMHPKDHKLFVYCRNRDKGAVAKKVCKVACIACSLCVKDCEIKGGIEIKGNLATINYETCPQDEKPTGRCPTKCILFGKEEKNTKSAVMESLMKKAG